MKPITKYISFTGTTGCYAEPPLAVLAGATDFTIEVKFSTTTTANRTNTYGGHYSAWEWKNIFGIEIGGFGLDDGGLSVNGGKLHFWCSPASAGTSTGNTKIVSSDAIVNDGTIHKVAVVSSNGAIDLYCDDVNVAHADNINAKISDSIAWLFAYNGNSNSYLQMDLYEARFWNVARSAGEIFADITGTETGLQGWYLPTADGLKDYSGNDRHATLYGSPAYNELTELPVSFTASVERVIKNDTYIKRIAQSLKVWLPFDESATADKCGNEWTTNGSPTISETNSVTGKALQLNGSSYLQMNGSLTLGGQDFTIDGWFNLSSSTGNWPRVFALFNTTNSDAASIQLQRREQTTNFQVCCNGAFSETFSVSLNTRHHFELDYVHSTSTVYVFIDGALMKTFTKTMDVTTYATVSLGLSNFTADAKFIGSIDEFQIYDGVALHTEKFTPPTAEFYGELAFQLDSLVEFTVDVERRISNVVEFTADVERKVINAWRYVNLGTADSLLEDDEGFISGTTLENLPDTKSVTGTAFYQTAREKCFDIPDTDEIWIKFDVYFDGSARWRAYNDGANDTIGVTAQTTDNNRIISVFSNGTNVQQTYGFSIPNQVQTVLLHMVSGSSAGVVEAWVDGTKIYTYTGDVNHGEDFADFYLQSDGSGTFFSNVVISNKDLTFGDGYQTFTADVECRLSNIFEFTVDVERKVSNVIAFDFVADVEIIYFLPVTFAADVERRITKRLEFSANVEIIDTLPFEFDADINRAIKGKVKLFAIDTSEYFSGGGLSSSGDSAETLTPTVIPSQEIIPAAPDNTIGLQSIEISLSEQQLTDNIAFVGVVPFDIMFPVKGQYLDYVFDMRVERVQQHGILYSCECCADIDQLLYTQLAYTIPKGTDWSSGGSSSSETTSDDKFVPAKFHASSIARTLGKTAVIQFDDFQSTVLMENSGGVTYADLIRDVFGWSSRVPTHMINVFIRDDKIYFVQRGHEARLIDLTGSKYSLPTITHELVRMTWGSTPWSKTETREIKSYQPPSSSSSSTSGDNTGTSTGDDSGGTSGTSTGNKGTGLPDIEKNGGQVRVASDSWEGYPESGYVTYTYNSDGLLIQSYTYVHNHETNQKTYTTVNHGYDEDGTLIYTGTFVQSMDGTDGDSSSQTEEYKGYVILPNGEKFLARESIIRRVGENSLTPTELAESKTIIHSPTRAGQGHTTVISDGEDIGGVVGQNTGDDRVTPFARYKANSLNDSSSSSGASGTFDALNDIDSSGAYWYNPETGKWEKLNETVDTQSRTINGLSLYDSSFPIHNTDKLIELTEAIKWLNRRTKETVTFTLYEYPHLIDFNDRIIFNGAQYFLVSNIATTDAHIFNEQRISMVRWY